MLKMQEPKLRLQARGLQFKQKARSRVRTEQLNTVYETCHLDQVRKLCKAQIKSRHGTARLLSTTLKISLVPKKATLLKIHPNFDRVYSRFGKKSLFPPELDFAAVFGL